MKPNLAVDWTVLGAASPASAAGYLAFVCGAYVFSGGVQMNLQTLLCIEFPTIQAPMSGVQCSALAVAVSNGTPVSRPRLPKARSA